MAPQMFELSVVPAYGRVYNSKAAIWSDWTADKDFQITGIGPNSGRYVNQQDVAASGLACILVRYGKRLEKTCSINLIKNRIN